MAQLPISGIPTVDIVGLVKVFIQDPAGATVTFVSCAFMVIGVYATIIWTMKRFFPASKSSDAGVAQ